MRVCAEPIVALQPSLHNRDDFVRLVLEIAHDLGADVDPEHDFGEWGDEALQDACDRLSDIGYANVLADDRFLVWNKGVDVPEEWRE